MNPLSRQHMIREWELFVGPQFDEPAPVPDRFPCVSLGRVTFDLNTGEIIDEPTTTTTDETHPTKAKDAPPR